MASFRPLPPDKHYIRFGPNGRLRRNADEKIDLNFPAVKPSSLGRAILSLSAIPTELPRLMSLPVGWPDSVTSAALET
jgi:hypothetical protein